jgi:hypothetical protein
VTRKARSAANAGGSVAPRFAKGQVYFVVKFFDGVRSYPQIDSFVYLGKNLSDDDTEDTWYFQFAESVATQGLVGTAGGGDREIQCATSRDVHVFVDIAGLVEQLSAAAARRSQKAE